MGNSWLFCKRFFKTEVDLGFVWRATGERATLTTLLPPGRTTQKPSIRMLPQKQHFLKQIISKTVSQHARKDSQNVLLHTLICSSTRSFPVIWDNFPDNLQFFCTACATDFISKRQFKLPDKANILMLNRSILSSQANKPQMFAYGVF